jgi:hypothetical protein
VEPCGTLGLATRLVPVTNARRINKQSMILNRCDAAHAGGSGNLRSASRRPTSYMCTRVSAAHGTTLFLVLIWLL